MHEFLKARPALAYTWFWIWFALVSAGTLFVYNQVAGLAALIVSDLSGLSVITAHPSAPWLQTAALYIAGVLFWWRVIKVMALHGAPLSLGMEIMPGRQDEGKSGRLATHAQIGDSNVYGNAYSGSFYYGAVFRAHPTSDKLMRSRLEFLVMFIPLLGVTLKIHESRVFIRKEDHKTRGQSYRLISDRYSKVVDSTTPASFRSEVTKGVQTISQYYKDQKNVTRIDGLNWHFYLGGDGCIMDDFGQRISFDRTEGGAYTVTLLQSKEAGSRSVDSLAKLRELAKTELDPVL